MFTAREKAPVCPLIGGKPCLKAGCQFWIKLRGSHPQSGEPIDHFDCAVKWLPILMIENTQQTRQAGAAIESFRNEMVRQNGQLAVAMTDEHNHRLLDGRDESDVTTLIGPELHLRD